MHLPSWIGWIMFGLCVFFALLSPVANARRTKPQEAISVGAATFNTLVSVVLNIVEMAIIWAALYGHSVFR